MTRVYGGALLLMSAGFGLASQSPTIAVAAVLAGVATVGNGAAIVCNQVLVQRGAPDAMRGRALAVLMSSYYAVLGLSMAGAGLLVDAAGARTAWAIAGCVYLVAAVIAFVLTPRAREAADSRQATNGELAGFERLRVLMTEVEETRRQEQERGATDVAVARDAEGRSPL
jgi:MFS family permease